MSEQTVRDLVNDRIRLAEAMGWTAIRKQSNAEFKDEGLWGCPPDSVWRRGILDPFTDANDDYAVLKWMRSKKHTDHMHARFRDSMMLTGTSMWRGRWNYKVGDYARAALKVIDNESSPG